MDVESCATGLLINNLPRLLDSYEIKIASKPECVSFSAQKSCFPGQKFAILPRKTKLMFTTAGIPINFNIILFYNYLKALIYLSWKSVIRPDVMSLGTSHTVYPLA